MLNNVTKQPNASRDKATAQTELQITIKCWLVLTPELKYHKQIAWK
jgi:hypothetical protein